MIEDTKDSYFVLDMACYAFETWEEADQFVENLVELIYSKPCNVAISWRIREEKDSD